MPLGTMHDVHISIEEAPNASKLVPERCIRQNY